MFCLFGNDRLFLHIVLIDIDSCFMVDMFFSSCILKKPVSARVSIYDVVDLLMNLRVYLFRFLAVFLIDFVAFFFLS